MGDVAHAASNKLTQVAATKRMQKVRAHVHRLDQIFDSKSGKASWWRSFKEGPIKFWLAYFFQDDEIRLWEAIHSHIHDLLDEELVVLVKRTGEIEARLKKLDAELTEQFVFF